MSPETNPRVEGISIDEALAAVSPDHRENARAALNWLLPEEDDTTWADLTQIELQGFLWYSLPMKWLVEPAEHHEVARALAAVFDAAGLDRYAALCRSETTHTLIDLWPHDTERARKQFTKAFDSSGVAVPDTDLLAWGAVTGVDEYRATMRVSVALEEALAAGKFVPGQRGWRQVTDEVTRAELLEPLTPDDPRTVLQSVLDERRSAWLRDLPRQGVAVSPGLQQASNSLDAQGPGAADARLDQVADTLEPLTWLLDRLADGAKLTQAGYLPKALALAADERYGWFEMHPFSTLRGESNLPHLTSLRQLAKDAGLTTTRRGLLSLSPKGRQARRRPRDFAARVLDAAYRPDAWLGEATTITSIMLLSAEPATWLPVDQLEEGLLRGLRTQFMVGNDRINRHDAAVVNWDVLRLLAVFGWVERDGTVLDRHVRVTEAGRTALLEGLRRRSTAPRVRP